MSRHATAANWTRLGDAELLKLRFSDLALNLQRSAVQRPVKRLYAELERRGIRFKPHVWLAEEWFSPDGIPGFAIPFYLAHPRLEQLERHMSREVEGGNANWLMRILRHEAGHAIDTAYRLRRRKRWREVFGPASLPYPARYRARPGSRRYVHHLGDWYAQAHPTEDFAESFAVWLKPNSAWRRNYADWPALQKVELVDALMKEVVTQRPAVLDRSVVEPLESNNRTLAQHYRRKRQRQLQYRRGAADELLQKMFSSKRARSTTPRVSSFLREVKPQLIAATVRDMQVNRYSVYQVLRMVISRSEKLGLFLRGNRRDAERNARWLLNRLIVQYQQISSPHLTL